MREDVQIYLNGTPLSWIGNWWGEPVITTRRRGGAWEVLWKMDLPDGYRHPDLVRGAKVLVRIGPHNVARGSLTEPDFDSLEFVAQGSCRQGEVASALDLTGATSNVGTALFYAASRGLVDWGSLETFTNLTASGATAQPNTLAGLLDLYATEQGTNWTITDEGALFTYADPTTPRYMVTPGAGVLGVADDDYWTNLVGAYLNTAGRYRLVFSSDTNPQASRRERNVDLTGFGRISSARAQTILDRMLAKGLARTGWTNGLEVARGQLLSMGGTPVSLSLARGGDMVHLAGLFDERGQSAFTNIILDETVWNVTEDTLQMNPVGLAARDLSSIIESMGGSLL